MPVALEMYLNPSSVTICPKQSSSSELSTPLFLTRTVPLLSQFELMTGVCESHPPLAIYATMLTWNHAQYRKPFDELSNPAKASMSQFRDLVTKQETDEVPTTTRPHATLSIPIHYWIGVMAPFWSNLLFKFFHRHRRGTEKTFPWWHIYLREVAELLGQAMTSCSHISLRKWRDQEAWMMFIHGFLMQLIASYSVHPERQCQDSCIRAYCVFQPSNTMRCLRSQANHGATCLACSTESPTYGPSRMLSCAMSTRTHDGWNYNMK